MSDPQLPTDAELLRAFLAKHDVSCPACAYNLRGTATEHCPECGCKIELDLKSRDVRQGPYIALVATLTCGVWLFPYYVAVAVTSGLQHLWNTRNTDRVWIIFSALSAVLLPLVIWFRRSLCRLNAKWQWMFLLLAIGGAFFPMATIVWNRLFPASEPFIQFKF